MPETPQVENNAVSDQSTDNVEGTVDLLDSFGDMRINENQDGVNATQSNPYLDRPTEPDCLFYLKIGSCSYGSKCRFNHPAHAAQGTLYTGEELPERVGQPDCEFYLKTGTCKYGPTCKYHHPKDRNGAGPISFNILGLPMRPDERSCSYYMRTGLCKFGSTCKFHHPQPKSPGTALPPVNGSSAYGPPVLSTSHFSYVGGFPSWSLARPPYISSQPLQGPTNYIPVAVSSSQGVLSVPAIDTYSDNAISGAQMNVRPSSSQNYPERPDQLECRYYMNTGTCKYGSDCKYHHSKERSSQFMTSTINPFGLPSRPGQNICSNYIMYGICKFGPACRFDHPLIEYPYNYAQPSMIQSPNYGTYLMFPSSNPSNIPHSVPSKFFEKPNTQHESSSSKKSINVSEQADPGSAGQQDTSEPSLDQP